MKGTKVITFRVSNEQRDKITEEARNNNISVSEYVRVKVFNEKLFDDRRYCTHLAILMTEIQRLKVNYPSIDFEKLEEEAEQLWLL